VRAEDVYAPRRIRAGTASVPVAEWAWHKYPPVFDGRDAPDLSRRGTLDESYSITAEVNQGRWVARCPFCPSAQVATPADPRFLCAGADGCANGAVGGAFVPVVFPDDTERTDIVGALVVRPRENRNWRAPETAADLIEENEAHGLDGA
jgi:hypothetical protein